MHFIRLLHETLSTPHTYRHYTPTPISTSGCGGRIIKACTGDQHTLADPILDFDVTNRRLQVIS